MARRMNTLKMKSKVIEKSKVIVDSRDGRKDKWIPTKIARELYEAGKLAIDVTNSVNERIYCPIEGNNEWMNHIL